MTNAARIAGTAIVALAQFALAATLTAQPPPVHYQHRADHPPGFVGGQQLLRGGPREGYFQPVQINVPEGTLVAAPTAGGFDQA